MKIWTSEDFAPRTELIGNSALEAELVELGHGYIVKAFAMIFVEAKRGRWGGRAPCISDVDEEGFLFSENYDYVRVHLKHPKFGNEIVEAAGNFHRNTFVFFDFSSFENVFSALDEGTTLPYVPTYYAYPEDRWDYDFWHEKWE